MANTVEKDLEFAWHLYHELNGVNYSADKNDASLESSSKQPASRSPVNSNSALGEVSFHNQQAITIKRERTRTDEFFMASMKTWIDLKNNQEWCVVNMETNLQQVFDKFKNSYFGKWLKDVKHSIKWDKNRVISDSSSFKVFESHNETLISLSAMIRPRIQLISIILHILVHIYLEKVTKGTTKLSKHDQNFRDIMLFLNRTINTEITTFHKFTGIEDDYANDWFHCTGICCAYEPFHGVIRSEIFPNESQNFWDGHEENCGGTFFRVFEMARTNSESGEPEKMYVRNVRYMDPKPRQCKTTKTNFQARAMVDLTNEDSENVTELCDVIDLDDSAYSYETVPDDLGGSVHNFVSQRSAIFGRCPLCETAVGTERIASHLDKCRGFQQKVRYNLRHATVN